MRRCTGSGQSAGHRFFFARLSWPECRSYVRHMEFPFRESLNQELKQLRADVEAGSISPAAFVQRVTTACDEWARSLVGIARFLDQWHRSSDLANAYLDICKAFNETLDEPANMSEAEPLPLPGTNMNSPVQRRSDPVLFTQLLAVMGSIQDAEVMHVSELDAGHCSRADCLAAMRKAQVEAVAQFCGSFGKRHADHLDACLRARLLRLPI